MPGDQHGQARFADDVRLIVADLGRAEAEVLHLIYFRGLSQAEAARVLGKSRATVRRCVARGMRGLADRLLEIP